MTNAKYEAWMDGAALGGISPDLYISEIACRPAARSVSGSEIVGRHGEQAGASKWKGATVRVSFILKKSTGPQRQAIINQVARWAMGTELEISDRPGEVLQVICTEPPYVPDNLSWADSISITFQTMEKPFWEKKTPETLTLESGTTGSGELYVPGNIDEAVVEVEAAPASGTLANITLTVGDTSITLNGINATAEAPLRITYDRRGIQSIKRGTTSVMDKRTAASADDLLAKCGAVSAVSFSASASASVTFRARGLCV